MTELQLYKWVQEIEAHYNHDFTELWACINGLELQEFWKITSPTLFDDEGLECVMKDGYICIDLVVVANYYGIDIENILPKTKEQQ